VYGRRGTLSHSSSAQPVIHPQSRSIAHALVLVLVLACLLPTQVGAGQPATSLTSETGKTLITAIEAGIPFEGYTATLDGATQWPGILWIRLKDGTTDFDGHIEWTSLNAVNYVEGTIVETGDFVEIDFTSTKKLVAGNAAVGVGYHTVVELQNGKAALLGRWGSGDQRGPCYLAANAEKAGTQSALLGGKSVDEMLASAEAPATENKKELWFEKESIDWKVQAYKYESGNHMVKLTCHWARDRLSEGRSLGELFFILTDFDDTGPLLGFTSRDPKWKQGMADVRQLEVYLTQDVQHTIDVNPNPETGWAISTGPVGRLITSAINESYHIDGDMIVYPVSDHEIRGVNISTSGLEAAWKATKILMTGQEPPPFYELIDD